MSTFVQSAQGHQAAAATLTASSITVTAGNALIVWVATLNSGNNPCSGNGNTYTYIGSSVVGGGVFISLFIVQNANGGATAVASSDTGCFGIYVQEQSGLATSGGVSGALISALQAGPGAGANIVSPGTVTVSTAPSTVFAINVDVGALSATANTGTIPAGTTLAWNSRTTGWLDSGVAPTSIAEDLDVGSSGSVVPTFGLTGNRQFATFLSAAFALPGTGGGGSNTASIAWVT